MTTECWAKYSIGKWVKACRVYRKIRWSGGWRRCSDKGRDMPTQDARIRAEKNNWNIIQQSQNQQISITLSLTTVVHHFMYIHLVTTDTWAQYSIGKLITMVQYDTTNVIWEQRTGYKTVCVYHCPLAYYAVSHISSYDLLSSHIWQTYFIPHTVIARINQSGLKPTDNTNPHGWISIPVIVRVVIEAARGVYLIRSCNDDSAWWINGVFASSMGYYANV